MRQRELQPELLDTLDPDDPAARHNRRDLRITNFITGTHRWLRRELTRHASIAEPVLEIGAGTGELGRALQRTGLAVDGLDLWARPQDWPAERKWHRADLRSFDGYARYPVICGNLIFHQFSADDLAGLGAQLRKHSRLIVACEPARRRISQVLYRALGPLFGANYVSLHDAHVSIAAGFRDDELPLALGLDAATWDIRCETSFLGIYRMVATRRS
jgi:hypothetical protein